MPNISSQPQILVSTPAKQPKKKVPDKALLAPAVRFGSSEQRTGGTSATESSETRDIPRSDTQGGENTTAKQKETSDSKSSIEKIVDKIYEIFQKLQERIEGFIDHLIQYLDELGKKLNTPASTEKGKEPSSDSQEETVSGSGETQPPRREESSVR